MNKWAWFLTSLLSPFVLWALLAIYTRRRPTVLRRLYPWVTGFCWTMWITYVVLMSLHVLNWPSNKTYFKFAILLWPAYGGLMLIRRWVGQHVDPDAYADKSDGWWPKPKTSDSKQT